MSLYFRAQILFVLAAALFGGWKWVQHYRFDQATLAEEATVDTIDRQCETQDGPRRCSLDELAGAYSNDGHTMHYVYGDATYSLMWVGDDGAGHAAEVKVDGKDPRFYGVKAGDKWPIRVWRDRPGVIAKS